MIVDIKKLSTFYKRSMDQSRVLVGAIDQGTSSSRFLIFDIKTQDVVCNHKEFVKNSYPQTGWVEVDAMDLLNSVVSCIRGAVKKLATQNISPSCIKAVGLTNQRETTVAFDTITGKPLHKAISWMDVRTNNLKEEFLNKLPNRNKNHFKQKCGLPVCSYASVLKMCWLSQNVSEVKEALKENRCRFATVDSWLLWKLTGGPKGGVFKTDVSNASRTGLLNINNGQWDPDLLSFFQIDKNVLAEVASSCEMFGSLSPSFEALGGVPISGILGDQMAALVGQGCLSFGKTKNTYGTGCFMLGNTGTVPVFSKFGLLTSVAYKMGPTKPIHYALEGSVAIAGQAIDWMKDNIGLFSDFEDCERQAKSVEDSGDCYFVPAFSGLLCPHWDSYARGTLCGLTQSTTRAHLIRACFESICFQSKDVAEAMEKDLEQKLKQLNVDGGVTANDFLMQLQADLLGIPVARPMMVELTALGIAYVAGSAAGVDVWQENVVTADASADNTMGDNVKRNFYYFQPSISDEERTKKYKKWKEAVSRARDWSNK